MILGHDDNTDSLNFRSLVVHKLSSSATARGAPRTLTHQQRSDGVFLWVWIISFQQKISGMQMVVQLSWHRTFPRCLQETAPAVPDVAMKC